MSSTPLRDWDGMSRATALRALLAASAAPPPVTRRARLIAALVATWREFAAVWMGRR